VFNEAKDDGSGGDNWSDKSCKAPVKSTPPTKALKGKISHSMDFLTPSSPGGLPT